MGLDNDNAVTDTVSSQTGGCVCDRVLRRGFGWRYRGGARGSGYTLRNGRLGSQDLKVTGVRSADLHQSPACYVFHMDSVYGVLWTPMTSFSQTATAFPVPMFTFLRNLRQPERASVRISYNRRQRIYRCAAGEKNVLLLRQ